MSYDFSIAAWMMRSGTNRSTTLTPGKVIRFHSSETGCGGLDFQAAICRTCSDS